MKFNNSQPSEKLARVIRLKVLYCCCCQIVFDPVNRIFYRGHGIKNTKFGLSFLSQSLEQLWFENKGMDPKSKKTLEMMMTGRCVSQISYSSVNEGLQNCPLSKNEAEEFGYHQ